MCFSSWPTFQGLTFVEGRANEVVPVGSKKHPILSVIVCVRVPGFQQGRHSNRLLLFIMHPQNILRIPLDLRSEGCSVILWAQSCDLCFPEEALRGFAAALNPAFPLVFPHMLFKPADLKIKPRERRRSRRVCRARLRSALRHQPITEETSAHQCEWRQTRRERGGCGCLGADWKPDPVFYLAAFNLQ